MLNALTTKLKSISCKVSLNDKANRSRTHCKHVSVSQAIALCTNHPERTDS